MCVCACVCVCARTHVRVCLYNDSKRCLRTKFSSVVLREDFFIAHIEVLGNSFTNSISIFIITLTNTPTVKTQVEECEYLTV